ncbi:MAG: MerC family mercury resistance protein [Rhodanobacteraceae bacterium]|nr:MAG: MerC family mercury resistance protein [Rhodanobacteraceae bacterium]
MKDLFKQLGSLLGALFAAACCLGLPLLLSALSAAGVGFLIHDAVLIPLLVAFVALNLWLLRRATSGHTDRRPFGLGVSGAALAVAGLYIHPLVAALGLLLLVVASFWGFANGRRVRRCAT